MLFPDQAQYSPTGPANVAACPDLGPPDALPHCHGLAVFISGAANDGTSTSSTPVGPDHHDSATRVGPVELGRDLGGIPVDLDG